MNRREFIAGGLTTAAASALGAAEALKAPKTPSDKLIWATKYQLGTHDQCGIRNPFDPNGHFCGDTFNEVDMGSFWRRMKAAKDAGVNLIRVNVLESLAYPSHPELGLKGSWSAERMHDVMKKVRDDYGMETIPALNFSTRHGNWLGWYSRMVSTPAYYKVCADILKDVHDVFGHPRFIHFGMDEECNEGVNATYNVVRLRDVYWHDVRFYVETIEKLGARGWCDADKEWWNPKEYADNMPKTVLQGNWYYASTYDLDEIRRRAEKAGKMELYDQFRNYLESFDRLEAAGYEQIPEGSCWYDRLDKAAGVDRSEMEKSFPRMVAHCASRIDPSRLKGFCMTHWIGTSARGDKDYEKFCRILAQGKKTYEEI